MYVAARVRVGDGISHLDGKVHRAADVDRPPGHLRTERLSFEEFKDDVDASFVCADLKHRCDVWMRQRDESTRLVHECLLR